MRDKDTLDGIGHGVRRLCIAVDREREGRGAAQEAAEDALTKILDDAARHGGLQRALWMRGPSATVALLPPGIDEARVIASLLRHLRDEVYRHSLGASTAAGLRLRVAVHEGLTYVAEDMYVGDVIDTVGERSEERR